MNQEQGGMEQVIAVYWQLCGQPSPEGEELQAAVVNMRSALQSGCQVPRTDNKNCQPLYGPRTELSWEKTHGHKINQPY